MQILADDLAGAADQFLETALVGGDWGDALGSFAVSSAGMGATLVRNHPSDRLYLYSRDEFVFPTESIAGPVSRYLRGEAPPDPRQSRVSPTMSQGFLTDYDQFTPEEIDKSPFYEEFLRSCDMRWHACACIDSSREYGQLFLSLKRRVGDTHYSPGEIGHLHRALPKLRMAAAISRSVLDAERRGAAQILTERGDAVFELDFRGRVAGMNELADALLHEGFRLDDGRLFAPLSQDQTKLDAAVSAPLGSPPQVACAVLGTGSPDRRLIVRTLPVTGIARDVFFATAAVAVVSVWERPEMPPEALVTRLRESFDLTRAEARVAALVCLGVTLPGASRALGIGVGTARNYFKSVQSKTETSTQSELASLVALMPRD
jgi:DNA-binding CsgD family transcriptional regulator